MRIKGGRASLPVPGIALILYLAGLLRMRTAEIHLGTFRNIFTGIPKTTAPAGRAPAPAPLILKWDSEGVSPSFGIRSIRNIKPAGFHHGRRSITAFYVEQGFFGEERKPRTAVRIPWRMNN